MNQTGTPPAGGTRTMYVVNLLKEQASKRHARRLICVRTKDQRRQLQLLRPVTFYEGSIAIEGKGTLFYPTLLLTSRNTLVRGVLHGNTVHYAAIAIGEVTDSEIRTLTRTIRGKDGLDTSEYLRIATSRNP